MDWQPIETAPKDGTGVLGWWPLWTAFPVRIWWQNNQWRMAEDHPATWYDGMPRWHGPTHWMPLPEPPGSDTANHPEIPDSSS
jgi:hypothetical protein